MNVFEEIAQEISNININSILKDFFAQSEIQKDIIETIQKRLNSIGEDSEGKKLKTDMGKSHGKYAGKLGFYSKFTEFIKKKKGQPIDHVTLNDTGAFFKTWILKVDDSFSELEANFKKTNSKIDSNFQDTDNFQDVVLSLSETEMNNIIQQKIIDYIIDYIIEHV